MPRDTYFKNAAKKKAKRKRVTEEDPHNWSPKTMGNKKGGGAYYYRKGEGKGHWRPD